MGVDHHSNMSFTQQLVVLGSIPTIPHVFFCLACATLFINWSDASGHCSNSHCNIHHPCSEILLTSA
eukprot:12742726-Prorocentrum_lima.AAC.1